jgi:glycosyltransferase involved in cell wall biosynthesis
MRPVFLILIPGFAKDETDSTCLPFAQSFTRAINKQYPELEVIVITLEYPHTSETYYWYGNEVIPLNGEKLKPRPLLWLKLYRLLKKFHKQRQLAGILNFWCEDNAMVSHYLFKGTHVPYFTWLRGQDAKKGNKAMRFFRPAGKTIIALSDFLYTEFYRNHHIQPAHIIYPGITANNGVQGNGERDIDIIGVGSLIPLKRYGILVDTVEKIKAYHPSVKAVLIGKGPEESRLRKMIAEKGLEDNITLAGELPHDQVPSFLGRSKLLLHPSVYEGYGVVCLEALAAGCHVVSFIPVEPKPVMNWNVVDTKEAMTGKCMEILQLPDTAFYPVVPHRMEDCVRDVMKLYGM